MTGWRAIWGSRRARLWLGAAIVAAWLPLLGVAFRGWLDFSAFYAAGALAFTPGLTSLSATVAYEAAHGLPITPWVYPAGLAIVYVPFTWLPYGLAGALHVAIEVGLLVAAAWIGGPLVGVSRRWALVGVFAWAPAAAGVISGQETALALLLVVLAARALGGARGGIFIGLLAFKPQLFAPQAGLVAWRRLWGVVVVIVGLLVGHYLLGVLA
ncbi:MAG: glycosyltransferase 87 family protein, partial [Candidatus Limnocylindrales bacterium]